MLMKFKEGDRVRVLRYDGEDVDFYGRINHISPHFYFIDSCTEDIAESTNTLLNLIKPNNLFFGSDGRDYYVLAEDEEDTEEPEVQHTESLDKGEIIAQSIIDNRDGASFTSAHDMIVWLNEIEEMHGENISVKGWNLIFDCVKTSIAPSFFNKEETICRQ